MMGKTLTEAQRKWAPTACHDCGGHGLVQGHWAAMAGDGPDECSHCQGKGYVWRSPAGRVAPYPGGPFAGRLALKEMETRDE